ncbi:MAG: phosphoribosylglycinamide formyltransferase [Ignavibacteria bacterium]|nr:phosphoribosylglycinamide formyltransferase [Ignavibacteria bacterium]
MFRIAVFVSGGGTNLQAIIDNIASGYLKNITIEIVISNKTDAYALKRAEIAGICNKVIKRKDFNNSDEYNDYLINLLKSLNVDLIVLAGFLSILDSKFVNAFHMKIINVHPALIPSFCGKGYYGLKVHEEVLKYGVKLTGATVHFVTDEIDGGPVILQKAVEVLPHDNPDTLQKRVMKEAEHIILPEAIKLLSENKIKVVGRKVIISND